MVKEININVRYNGKNHLMSCQKHQFPDKITEKFNVNIKDVFLYAVLENQRYEIIPQQIEDLMKIEMVPKTIDQRHLHNNSSLPKPFEGIVQKLTRNSTLTGTERKILIEFIEEHTSSCKKRRLNGNNKESDNTQVDLDSKKITPMIHKKVQVDMRLINKKESVTQTDRVNLTSDKSSNSEDICQKMKKITQDKADTEEAMLLMEKSFDDRRQFILLKCPPIALVKEKYQLLFNTAEVKRELDRLNFPGKCAEFLNNMKTYAPIILKHCSQSDDIFVRTKKNMDRFQTAHQKHYAEVVGSIFALARLLEEEFRFIHLSDYPHGSDDMYPYIDASCNTLNQCFFDDVLYHIYVEGIMLCDAADFPEAVLCLTAGFFIFNIDYPEYCRRTLTAIEKLYLCASDTKEMDVITDQMIKYLQLQAQPGK